MKRSYRNCRKAYELRNMEIGGRLYHNLRVFHFRGCARCPESHCKGKTMLDLHRRANGTMARVIQEAGQG